MPARYSRMGWGSKILLRACLAATSCAAVLGFSSGRPHGTSLCKGVRMVEPISRATRSTLLTGAGSGINAAARIACEAPWERRRKAGRGLMSGGESEGAGGGKSPSYGEMAATEGSTGRLDPWDAAVLSFKMRALYVGWFAINFTDKMWEFSVPFLLLSMDSMHSMQYATVYAVTVGVANILFGPIVGHIVKKFGRRRTVSVALASQGIFVSLAWVIANAALGLVRAPRQTMVNMIVALVATCTASSLGRLACTMAIERDWINCLAEGSDILPRAQSRIRAISTLCRILAPFSMGFLLCNIRPERAAGGVAMANVFTALGLMLTLRTIYKMTPELAMPKAQKRPRDTQPLSQSVTLERYKGSNSRWGWVYRAAWREYLDINGDGRIDRSEYTFGIRAGFARCWDLWAGCFAGGFLVYWIRQIVMMPYV